MRARITISTTLLAAMALTAGGCYEDAGGSAPVPAQTPAPPPKQGPLTTFGQQPASSALGKAKQTAGNIAERAEQKSREDAKQADDPFNDKPKRDPAPTDEPPGDPG